MRRTSLVWLLFIVLTLFFTCTAIAETASYNFSDKGVRLYLDSSWQVLTLSNLNSKTEEIQKMGTTAQALMANYQENGTLLEAFPSVGGQIRLQWGQKPAGIDASDAFAMTQAQKDAFLLQLAQSKGYEQGAWSGSVPEFAVFHTSSAIQTLSVKSIVYATVRYNCLYTVTVEIIGRDITQADEEVILDVVSSLVFLGAQAEPEATVEAQPKATLEPLPAGTPAPAEVKVQRDETPLTLDYAPSITHTSSITVTGQTEPNTSMRYYVNGQGYERFTADQDGRFSINIRTLPKSGKNQVAIYAIGDKGYGVVSFNVLLDQVNVPMTITPFEQGVEGGQALITGAVLPGASVQVLYRTTAYDAVVNQDGSFSCLVDLKKLGENLFTVRATMDSYLRKDEKLTIIRLPSDIDKQEAFLKSVKKVDDEKLAAKPEAYADVPMEYEGRVAFLTGQNGQPMVVVQSQDGQSPIAVLVDNLNGIELDENVHILCTLTGKSREVPLSSGTAAIPEARLNWLLSSK